jgi:hypothetical protein
MANVNPLLTPQEQAHIDDVRERWANADEHQGASTESRMGAFIASVDWHQVFVVTASLLALASIVFVGIKLGAIWLQYPGMIFVSFLDAHIPLMLFSAAFTINYIRHSEGMAIIALLSTMLNALLV